MIDLNTSSDLMTSREAASYLGFRINYLHKLTMNRQIPFYRPAGRLLLFRRSELDAWVNGSRVTTSIEQLQKGGVK